MAIRVRVARILRGLLLQENGAKLGPKLGELLPAPTILRESGILGTGFEFETRKSGQCMHQPKPVEEERSLINKFTEVAATKTPPLEGKRSALCQRELLRQRRMSV